MADDKYPYIFGRWFVQKLVNYICSRDVKICIIIFLAA